MTPDDDGVLHAAVGGFSADAELVFKNKALAAIANNVSWSVKEVTGLHFHESRALHTGETDRRHNRSTRPRPQASRSAPRFCRELQCSLGANATKDRVQ